MRPIVKRVLKTALWGLAACAVIAGGILLRLVYIGRPDQANSLEFRGFIPLPSRALLSVLDYLTVSDQGLFITNESTGDVYKVALHANAMPRATDVKVFASQPAAHGVALDASKRFAYVTRSEVNAVDIFDPVTLRPLARLPVADDPDAIVFDAVHNLIYAGSGDANAATLIDPQTRSVIATIPVGGKPEFVAVDPTTRLIYQNLQDIDAVAAIDPGTRSVAHRWPLPGCRAPSGVALDEKERRLFIACSSNALLAVFDLNAHRVASFVSIGGGPDSVAFDPELRRIYTAGKAGVLTVIRQDTPDAYHVLDSITLHYGAHTLAVDPATHLLYVGYASLVVQPRVAVFAPRP
jgi:YVTN family beta-propeller protein